MSYLVHKQPLVATDVQALSLPLDAELLCVREQHGSLCLWYRFEEAVKATQTVTLAICGTGHAAPSRLEGEYLDTVLMHGGSLVLHVFVRKS